MKKLIAIATFGLLASASSAMANPKCDPDFTISNKKPTAVKVVAVQYKIENSSEWKEEGLGNRVLAKNGGTDTWKNQTLGSVAEGVLISQTRVVYEDDTGRGWSGKKLGPAFSHTNKCTDTANYHQDVK